MVIIEDYERKPNKNGPKFTWYSLVYCEHELHPGIRERTIPRYSMRKGVGIMFCKNCRNKELGFLKIGKPRSEETKLKISKANIGKKHSEEAKKKISEASKLIKWSDERKRIFSESRSGSKNPNFGKPVSQKRKNAQSEKMKGRMVSEETRQKLREANSGQNSSHWNPNREEVELNCKISDCCRSLIRRLVKLDVIKKRRKHWKAEGELGYSYSEFKQRIESTWEDWMNWENYGETYKIHEERKWCVDHIRPIVSFTREGIVDPKIINNLTNLRAFDSNLNSIKQGKYHG